MANKTMTAEGLKKVTTSLLATGAKFNKELQAHIINILEFCYTPGKEGKANENFSPATDLVKRIPRKADKASLRRWFSKHGNMRWQEFKAANGKQKEQPEGFKKATKGEFAPDFEAAKNDLWYVDPEAANGNGEAKKRPIKLTDTFAKLITTLDEHKEAPVDGDEIPDFLYTELKALYLRYSQYVASQKVIAEAEAAKAVSTEETETAEAETVAEEPKPVTRARRGGNRRTTQPEAVAA